MLNDQYDRLRDAGGFTLVEITIAILILTVAILGVASSTGQMIGPAITAEADFHALQAAESRLAMVSLEPRYTKLDSLFGGTENGIPGLDEFTRKTVVTRTRQSVTGGGTLDYTTIVVTVTGPRLHAPVYRKLVVAAP